MKNTQKRAKVGGERGANGDWYEGGKFIATSKARVKQHGSVKTGKKVEIEPYVWVDEREGFRPLMGLLGWEHWLECGAVALREGLDADCCGKESDRGLLVDLYNSGERWVSL